MIIMKCVWCNISRDYYISDEHASRQNCLFSDSGYHDFAEFPCCWRIFRRNPRRQKLLARRRIKRPNTI